MADLGLGPHLCTPVPCSCISAGLTGSCTPGWQPSGPVLPSLVVLMCSWAFLKSSAASVLRCWLDWHAGPRPQLNLAVLCPEMTPVVHLGHQIGCTPKCRDSEALLCCGDWLAVCRGSLAVICSSLALRVGPLQIPLEILLPGKDIPELSPRGIFCNPL